MLDPTSAETAEVFRAAENSINENYEMARKTILRAEIRAQLEQILTQWRTYDQQSRDIIKLAGEDAAAANPKVLPLYKQVFKPFQAELEKFIMERRREADEAEKIAAETSSNTVWKIMAILALVIAANFGGGAESILLLAERHPANSGKTQGLEKEAILLNACRRTARTN